MPIVKIVPMPGPQGPGGNGEGGDIADFVFTYDSEDTESIMSVANHDMIIRTTRSGTQDADINLESADDVFIRANGDDVAIAAKDEVRITSNDYDGNSGYEWKFDNSGRMTFPDGTVQSTAANGVIPPSGFLDWREGTSHLPDLNTNFGWDSDGIWFTDAVQNEGGIISYPIFTDFTVAQNEPVIVRFDVAINDECSDVGVCVYLDDNAPEWSYGTNTTRIAAQFDCIDLALYGRTTQTVSENTPVPDAGIYTVTFTYNPTAPTDKVVVSYTAQNSNVVIASISLNEALPAGAYRIGFAADQNSSTTKTYISNLTIDVNNDTDSYVSNLQIGNSLVGSDTAANTGDITFEGNAIIGNGTMNLVPNADLLTNEYSQNQYLIIDPTAPNHIHIRAGGNIDESTAELILGGERNSVVVSDAEKEVKVSTAFRYKRYFTNLDSNSGTEFIVSETADILVGDTVYVNSGSYIVDAVTSFDEGLVAVTAEGVTFAGGAQYLFTREEAYNSEWLFGSDGVLSGPFMGSVVVPGLAGTQTDDLYIQSPNNDIVILSSDGDIILNADSGVHIGSTASPENEIATKQDLVYRATSVPASSIGQLSDVAGLVADDASYHYYCTGTYDGDTHIWKRIAWSNDTWPGV